MKKGEVREEMTGRAGSTRHSGSWGLGSGRGTVPGNTDSEKLKRDRERSLTQLKFIYLGNFGLKIDVQEYL